MAMSDPRVPGIEPEVAVTAAPFVAAGAPVSDIVRLPPDPAVGHLGRLVPFNDRTAAVIENSRGYRSYVRT